MSERRERPQSDTWDVEALFPTLEAWEEAYKAVTSAQWLDLVSLRGRLAEGGAPLVHRFLEGYFFFARALERLYTYAHLRHDEDITEERHKALFGKISALFHTFHTEMAWFEPELLEMSDAQFSHLLRAHEVQPYRFFLEKIRHRKEHTLSANEEAVLASAQKPLEAAHRAFSSLNDADLQFGVVKDSAGEEHPLTHARYLTYQRSADRLLRKNAFSQLHGAYPAFHNTLGDLLSGTVQGHLFAARNRKYRSCLEAALFPKMIPPSVYHALVESVRDRVTSLHRYVRLRKQLLGVETLHLYDLQVPLVSSGERHIPYEEAEEMVIASVAPLGEAYQQTLREGLQKQRWVDRYENRGKRSGAYSSGCYDSHPYILMNYRGTVRDLFTLTHEAGHSMHSLLSYRHQLYHDAHYSIFVAEVASTFHEQLLFKYLLERSESEAERQALVHEQIEEIRATFFRQTLFAEFELFLHEQAERDIPLTPATLSSKYLDLSRFYFGPEMVLDAHAEVEWARIPHFYYNFYVYQYATGLAAASRLATLVLEGGKAERDAYLSFLQGGGSDYPVALLQRAGVDMTTPHVVHALLDRFDSLLDKIKDSSFV